MSYILDALKRADAERERGAAPGLHTRHQIPSSNSDAPSPARPLWLAVAGGVALLALAAALWFWRAPAVTVPPPAPTPMPAPAGVAEAPKLQMQPVATPAPAKTTAEPAVKAVPSAKVAASAPAPVVVEPLLADLPQDLRSQIPRITITGSVYSDAPAQRLLLVNNLVLAQGAQVASELTLEDIQRGSSVFSFRGTRFRVMH